ncbi:MAG: hypothetical protein WD990_09390 [Acidimicrobiia bacterium]
MITSLLTTCALLVSSLAAALVLTGADATWNDGSGAMTAAGHLMLTSIAIVGALIGAARWARWMGVGLAGILAVPAILQPITAWWVVMVGSAGIALAGLIGPGLRAVVRQRPPAGAPPVKATALVLGLLSAPIVVGAVQPDGVTMADWALVATSVLLAVWYTRAHDAALWGVRFGVPVLAAFAALAVSWPTALLPAGGFVVLSRLAWSTDARIAVIPLASPGRSVPIPAELTPDEIRDAAGIDSRGRRKNQP